MESLILETVGIGIAVFCLFILGLLSHAIYCSMLPQERRPPREPGCGNCHYASAGLDSWICPECGSDLRIVGIAMPRGSGQLRTTLFVGLLAWTTLCAVLPVIYLIASGGRESAIIPSSFVWVVGGAIITSRRIANARRLRSRTAPHSPPPPAHSSPDTGTPASAHGA